MTLLLLGGTSEARDLDAAFAARGQDAVFSLAGEGRTAHDTALPQRRGGFGGEDGFRRFVAEAGIAAVLDATHPFAIRITRRTARLCGDMSLPYLQVLRPPWRPGPKDQWVAIDREEEASAHVPPGARVFIVTGRATLERFANLADRHLICRQIDPPESAFPFPNGQFLVGEGPFSVEEEMATFRAHKVDVLICKNAGGEAPRSKLVAARELGIPVILLNRPQQPDAPRVETVSEALDWVAAL